MKISDIKAALDSKLMSVAGVASRVYVERETDIPESQLPCIVLSLEGATPDRKIDHSIEWTARFGITVYTKAAGSQRPDTTAETILGQVLALLYADMTLGGVVPDEIEFGPLSVAASMNDQVSRQYRLEVSASYVQDLYGQATDDFLLAAVEIDMASPRNDPPTPTGPDGQIDASVSIALPNT